MRIYFKQNALYQYARLIITHFTLSRRIFRLYDIFPIYETDYNELLANYATYKHYLKSKSIVIPDGAKSKTYLQLFETIRDKYNNLQNENLTIYKWLKQNPEIFNKLKSVINIPDAKINITQKKKAELISFLTSIYIILKEIFPATINIHKTYIIPTYYGSGVGFNLEKSNNINILKLYIRHDAPFSTINKGNIRAILYPLLHSAQLTPAQRTTIEHIIIKYSRIAQIVDAAPASTEISSKLVEQIYKRSKKVLDDFNINTTPQDIYISDNILWVYGKPTNIKLSPTETKFLQFLITNRDHIINYYRLGDLLWPNDASKFSMWAISQLVYKIRYKLHKAGFPEHKLKNVKGRGYVLVR